VHSMPKYCHFHPLPELSNDRYGRKSAASPHIQYAACCPITPSRYPIGLLVRMLEAVRLSRPISDKQSAVVRIRWYPLAPGSIRTAADEHPIRVAVYDIPIVGPLERH